MNSNQVSTLTVIAEAGKLSKIGAKFVSVLYTSKESGEVAKFVLLLGSHYGRLLKSSLKIVKNKKIVGELQRTAKEEVVASLNQSIESFETDTVNPDYTNADTYEPITVGVKVHKTDGTIYLSGVVVHKSVIVTGNYKTVNSKPLTIEKNKLKKNSPISKWRQFIVSPENVHTIKMGGKEIRFEQ